MALGFDLVSIIKTVGYVGVGGIVFAESGLLIGFFLPGDSLLFTAGFLASQGFLNIWYLLPIVFVCAVVGDSVGYSFGLRAGPKIFNKPDGIIFNKDHITKTQQFYEKHGGKTIILARFLPVIRTFAPILAGVGKMHYKTFLSYNLIGGFLWGVGLTLLGYFLGKAIPDIDKYLIPIILLIVAISVAPTAIHILKDKETRAKLIGSVKTFFSKKSK